MAFEEEKQHGDGIGFAGLSSMVSDVDSALTSPPKRQQREAPSSSKPLSSQAGRPERQEQPKPAQQSSQTGPPERQEQPKPTHQSSQASHPKRQERPKPTQQTIQTPAQPSGDTFVGKWLLGIAAVIGVIWLASQLDTNSSSRPTYSPGPSSTTDASTPAWQPPAAKPQTPSRLAEQKPSVGSNNKLSTAQIRYCLAEKIRMEGMEPASPFNDDVFDVKRFNRYADDYSSRCGEFRYRQDDFEVARKDVEPYRIQLRADGRSRFDRPSVAERSKTPAEAPQPVRPSPREVSGLDKVPPAQKPQPVRPSPDTTVQAIQLRLNELGYDAGAEDGVFGNKTRLAILAFQRDSGHAADGAANTSLLRQLELIGGTQRRENPVPASRPPVISSPSQPSVAQQSTFGVSNEEKAAVERVCDSARKYSGPSEYQSCLNRELASLRSSGGRPDLSFATSTERTAIERACDSARQHSGPGAYYNCLNWELSSLRSAGGRPDLSSASTQEQAAIEGSCDRSRQYRGPGEYYSCLKREMASLRSSGGRPSFSSLDASSQKAIERACDSSRQYSGPGDYYICLRRELSKTGHR